MNILREIIAHKQIELQQKQAQKGIAVLKQSQRKSPLLDFRASLSRAGIQIIAEVKRKSPSAGSINIMLNPVTVAQEFEQNGAAAISVLTDEKYFGGSLEILRQIKSAVSIPVLRKDFIISEYQVYESLAAGADAILLIADVLDPEQLDNLYRLCLELGMAALVEVHSQDNIGLIQSMAPGIVGVNSRDLETMKTDLKWLGQVFDELPHPSIKIAESGINISNDLNYIQDIGYDAALIGTSLIRSDTPGETLSKLLAGDLK